MRKRGYLLLFLTVIIAFWQIFFLQKGMKWDFVDAFLSSRYFFSESILNNQFPLWNPYLLYGTPIFADLVSVFNPEFWIVANLFGYSNITLQFVFLAYIFIGGVSFRYFLKQFNVEQKLSLAFSVAYMLSGLSIGNAQHLAFVYGYAIVPFILASYFSFIHQLNTQNFVRLSISLFLIIFGGYPGITIILGYFLLCIFLYSLKVNWFDKSFIKKLIFYHIALIITVFLFSAVLLVAYFQGAPFLSRYSGVPINLAEKHAFTFKSVISFILPMTTGADTQYFGTDPSMSNAYFGIISLVLFLFALIKRGHNKESRIILFFGIFSLLASFGDHFFLREFLYNYFPLMNMFKYPSIFRGFVIFSFLAFAGINLKDFNFSKNGRKILGTISGVIFLLILVLILNAFRQAGQFTFFQSGKSFVQELSEATRFDDTILQGIIQLIFLAVFIFLLWKIKESRKFTLAMLLLFLFDGIISTQLNIHYTVIGETNPIKFYNYLKSSPKGFPIPELNPIGENSDKNAQNDFVWINDNVFPKKVTFDGLVSFKLDGYAYLSDNYPELLEAIKKEPVIYFSDDVRENSNIKNFTSKTVFLSSIDFAKLKKKNLHSSEKDYINLHDFSPTKIEIKVTTESPQLLVYQQNYFTGWRVFIDGQPQDLLKSNFTYMAVLVPSGEHVVSFEYKNSLIKYAFCFSYLIFIILVGFLVYFLINQYPEKKKQIMILLVSGVIFFVAGSLLNRYFYQKNRKGLSPVIIQKTEEWRGKYNHDINILLSTHEQKLKSAVPADTVFYVDEKTNRAKFSQFLKNSVSDYFVFAWQGGIINDDLKELLYSFYPEIIYQKIGNNSGIIMVGKDNSKFNYIFSQTFEEQRVEGWMNDVRRIKTDTVSGNHAYFFDASDEWGKSIEIPVESKMLSLKRIVIISDFLFENNVKETLLVFTTERNGEMQLYEVSKVNEFANKPRKWGRMAFSVNVKSQLQEGDIIKIYFWNISKIPFEIDNLKLRYIYNN